MVSRHGGRSTLSRRRALQRVGDVTAGSLLTAWSGRLGQAGAAHLDPARLADHGLEAWSGWPYPPRFNGVQPLVEENAGLVGGVEPSWRPHCYRALPAAAWPYGDVAPIPPGIDTVHRFEVAGHGRASSRYAYGEAGYGDSAYWGMGGKAIADPTAPDGWASTGFDDRMSHVADDLELRERCEWSANNERHNAVAGMVDEISFWLYLPRRIVRGPDGSWPLLHNNESGHGWGPTTILYQNARDHGAGFMLREHSGRLVLVMAWSGSVKGGVTVVPRAGLFDRWVFLRFRTHYDVRDGRLQIWRFGLPIYDETGATLPTAESFGYAKFGLYTSYLGKIRPTALFTSRTAPRRNAYYAGLTRRILN